jgi:hypothetical protein
MSKQLRRQLTERHGAELADVLYETEIARRKRLTERALRLNGELADARAQFDVQSEQLAQNLPPLRAAMEAAYEVWLAACNALEARRVCNDAALSPLMTRIAELTTQAAEPVFNERVTQWQRPDWYTPTQEIPPMARH